MSGRTAQENRKYQARVKVQTLRWAEGRPYHNTVDNECCPDFSCCIPSMLEKDEAKRWAHYKDFHCEPAH